jgi:hypothetical protein
VKRIDGEPVSNGSARIRIEVTKRDIEKGAPLNPNACAIALACVRQIPKVTAAKVHLGRVYLLFEGEKRWRRWLVPGYARIEIIVFDRGGRFVPQQIDLMPPPVEVLARYRKSSPSRSSSRGARSTRKRVVHRVEGVRDSAHANEPREK